MNNHLIRLEKAVRAQEAADEEYEFALNECISDESTRNVMLMERVFRFDKRAFKKACNHDRF